MRPGMVSAVNAWKTQTPHDRELNSMQDGYVWKEIKGPDGESFFHGPDAEKEIRLGVSCSLDWYIHFNLFTSLRYRAENLILNQMPPGPKEPTADQLQSALKIVVDDLLMLYDEGITVVTPEHPNDFVCALPWLRSSQTILRCANCELFTDKSLRNEFPARDGEEHRRLCYQYRDLATPEEKAAFFVEHGAHWTEFARIHYFDLVRYTIIDPMHNLLLGELSCASTLKSTDSGTLSRCGQNTMVHPLGNNTKAFTRELHVVHEFLETFESPPWAGRLPLRVGEPAGGSLTADEYKFAVTGPWAVAIPIVWERSLEESNEDYKKAYTRYEELVETYKEKKKAWARSRKKGDPPIAPKEPVPRIQPGEDINFLRFAIALKILVGSSIRLEGLDRAKQLLQEYLLNFAQLYGRDEMKPNHHWAIHVPDQVLDYGPLYSIWAFLTERLNKVLKNLNSNNWSGGLLEVSMMREFHRMAQLDGLLNRILEETSGSDVPLPLQLEHKFIKLLFGTGQGVAAMGTIQDAAVRDRTMSRVSAGSVAEKSTLIGSDVMRLGLVNRYNKHEPTVHLPFADLPPGSSTKILGSYVQTYNYALLHQQNRNSLAHLEPSSCI
ncbi:hypothetical protein B0H13DRAFT_2499090 [Mycena leptocephala]|nr:hypothetical protein B0H13DRAFT_2499090 [Mycena leptocephala]